MWNSDHLHWKSSLLLSNVSKFPPGFNILLCAKLPFKGYKEPHVLHLIEIWSAVATFRSSKWGNFDIYIICASHYSLFVFLIDGPKQNATSLLTPVSNIVFYALSSGTLSFALHGSSISHFLIGGNSSTAKQILSCKWLLKLPWRAKPRVPLERA